MKTFDETDDPLTLKPQELEAVYAIDRAIARAESIEDALDEIVSLTRAVFIFDTMVLYMPEGADNLAAKYARIVGRGKSAEGELAWGESIAEEAYLQDQTLIRREEAPGWPQDRMALHLFLALPLHWADQMLGSLVFTRFGGPAFTPEQVHLAEFIGSHVAQLLGRQQLVERIASLEAERRLDQLQQDFIATVSHELCTPLGFIKGYATTLLRQDTSWDEATRREFLSIIEEEADKLRELIDNLLDSSRLQSGLLPMQLQPIRLDSLLRDICVRTSSHYQGLDLQLVLKHADVRCNADPLRIAQVLDNLIANAIKYAPGSPITISLDLEGERAHVYIADQGPGISPEHQVNLFKRFYRIPEATSGIRGTGLGLFICRQIIEAHGGAITVESVKGQGTVFHIFMQVNDNGYESVSQVEEDATQ